MQRWRRSSTFEDRFSDGGTDSSPEAGAPCSTSSECRPGLACGFLQSLGCAAKGSCVQDLSGLCGARTLCLCDGTTISSGACSLGGGYERFALAHEGSCNGTRDASPDASGCSHPCSIDETCAAQECRPLCGPANPCTGGTTCNAGKVCLPPPGCEPPDGGIADGGCSTVCYGYCE